MRLIKMLSFAATAAVAVTAFLGASSATAGNTLLCLNNTGTLSPTTQECNPPTIVHYTTNGKGTLLTENGNAQCEALIQGTTTGSLVSSGPVSVTVTALNYFNCTATCVVQALETSPGSGRKGTLLVLKTAANLTSVVAHELEVFVRCFFGLIECEYTGVELIGHGLGATSITQDQVSYSEVQASSNGLYEGCPESAKLDTLFGSLTGSKVYIRS